MKNKAVKKSILFVIAVAILVSTFSLFATAVFADESSELAFLGLGDSNSLSRDELSVQTNATKNSDGTYTNPVSTDVVEKI